MLRIDGLTFDGGAGSGGSGPHYTLASYERSASMRRERVPRPNAAGLFVTPGYLEEQEFRWSGLILTESEYAQRHAIDRVSSLLGSGGTGRLNIDFSEVRWADVQRGEIPEPVVVVPGKIAKYQILVTAPDPYLWGETRTYAQGQQAVNRGTLPVAPVIEITGPAPGYTVTGPGGKTFVVTQSLSAGQTHRIDMATGRVYRNGVLQVGIVSNGGTWTIPPGGGVTHAASAGTMRVFVTDKFG